TAMSTDFVEVVGPDAKRIVIEITEHAPVDDYDALNAALKAFRDDGGRLAVDDAGAGFSSLRHILRLAPDFIKLDGALTRGITTARRVTTGCSWSVPLMTKGDRIQPSMRWATMITPIAANR